jgi:hypothetical protein
MTSLLNRCNVPHHRAAANRPDLKERRGRRLRVHVVVMPLFDLPETPNFVTATVAACSRKYHECVEQFLRSIGVTEQNAHEYEMRTHRDDGLNAEIWHNGEKVGEVVTRWETGSGYTND